MNSAIDFDHQPQFNAIEIDNELIDQVLPPELDPEFFCPQLLPQDSFGVSSFLPHIHGNRVELIKELFIFDSTDYAGSFSLIDFYWFFQVYLDLTPDPPLLKARGRLQYFPAGKNALVSSYPFSFRGRG
jgi:hypothetical protein